jgi:hypothetical protein
MSVYNRDGSVKTTRNGSLVAHQSDRVSLTSLASNTEGLVIVSPVEPGDEFPSLLTICGVGQDYKVGNRFVPFMRVDD